jgi:hypothetical protein
VGQTANISFQVLLLAVSVAGFNGCNSQPQQIGASPDAYVGRSVAAYVADHGSPDTSRRLADRQATFQWVTSYDVRPALGEGVLIGGAPSAQITCTVTLTASTQSPDPDPKDWIIQGVGRQGIC